MTTNKQFVPDGIFLLRVSGALSIVTGIVMPAIMLLSRDEVSTTLGVGLLLTFGFCVLAGAVAFIPSPKRSNKWAIVHVLASVINCFTVVPALVPFLFWSDIAAEEWPDADGPIVGSRRVILAALQVGYTVFALGIFALTTAASHANQPSNQMIGDDGGPQVITDLTEKGKDVQPAKGSYDTWGERPGDVWFASDNLGEPFITLELTAECEWQCESPIEDATKAGEELGIDVIALIEDCPTEDVETFLTNFAQEHGEANYYCSYSSQIDPMWEWLPAIRVFDSTGRIRYVDDDTLPSTSKLVEIVKAAEASTEMAPPIMPDAWKGEWCLTEADILWPSKELDRDAYIAGIRKYLAMLSTRVLITEEGTALVRLAGNDTPHQAKVTHASKWGVFTRIDDDGEGNRATVVLREFDDGLYMLTTSPGKVHYSGMVPASDGPCFDGPSATEDLNFGGEANDPESWAAKPPTDWPQILLTNDFGRDAEGYRVPGASSFLITAGDRLAVATARHLIEESGGFDPKLQPSDVESAPIPWKAFPRGNPDNYVEAKNVVTDYSAGWIDALALQVADPPKDLPAEPLKVRESLPGAGEPVVVLVCEYQDGACPQMAVRGVVLSVANAELPFEVLLERSIDLSGTSGAPIVDRDGRVLGLMKSAYTHEDRAVIVRGISAKKLW